MNSTETDQSETSLPTIPRADWGIALGLFLLTFFCLFLELSAPGITWDEGDIQFPVAKKQAQWIHDFFRLEHPLSQKTIDAFWFTESDHPSPPRTLAALSYLLFSGWMDEITALRIPSAMEFSLLIASLYLFLRLFLSRSASLIGTVALAMMPRVWGHAHLFSLDVPMMCWWFWTAAAGFLVYHGKLRPAWFGVAYACAFSTKLHAVFLPGPLLAWVGIMLFWVHRQEKDYWRRAGWAALWTVIFTPTIYLATQPWLWHDPIARIYKRFFDLATKTPISLYYLGSIYTKTAPWHYPLVMFFYTVPATLLLLMATGLFSPWVKPKNFEQAQNKNRFLSTFGIYPFLLLFFLTPLMIFVLQLAKAYDGCRLFLPAFPLAACLAGFGYQLVIHEANKKINATLLHVTLWVLLITHAQITYAHLRPYYLAYYNELAYGISGAKDQGMETVYWCDALTPDFLKQINALIPEGRTIKPCSMSFGVYEYYRSRGWVRPAISDPADYYLLQSRQGMFRSEEVFLYTHRKPIAAVKVGGVQLYGLYEAPRYNP